MSGFSHAPPPPPPPPPASDQQQRYDNPINLKGAPPPRPAAAKPATPAPNHGQAPLTPPTVCPCLVHVVQ